MPSPLLALRFAAMVTTGCTGWPKDLGYPGLKFVVISPFSGLMFLAFDTRKPLSFDAVRGAQLTWLPRLLSQVGKMQREGESQGCGTGNTGEEDSNDETQTEQ